MVGASGMGSFGWVPQPSEALVTEHENKKYEYCKPAAGWNRGYCFLIQPVPTCGISFPR